MQLLAAIALTATLYLPLVGGSNVAFPNNPVPLDTFNRADEMPTSLNWEDVLGLMVRSNQAIGDRGGNGFSLWNPVVPLGANVDAYATIPTIDILTQIQATVHARYDPDAETGYYVRADYLGGGGGDQISIVTKNGAVADADIANYAVTLSDGDKIGIRCDGNNISAYHYTGGAWALLGTVVDATYPGAGLCGLMSWPDGIGTSAIPLDDFGCGNETGAAFPEPAVVDDFNRVDQGPPPSTSWVDQYVMGVVSNQAAARQTPNNYEASMLWRLTIAQDQEVYVTVPVRQNDGNDIYLWSRYQDTNNNIVLDVLRDDMGGDTVVVGETVAGVNNVIGGPYAIVFQDGDAIGIAAYGTTVEAWHKPVAGVWTLLGSGTTTLPLATGQIGLDAQDTTVRFDDFGGGPYAPPVPPGPWRQGTGRAKSGGTRSGKVQDVAAYSITTPDGITTDLRDKGFTVGIGDIQDGMGMPPVEHKTWTLFNNPGALLRSIQVGPRVVTINATLDADCLQALHDLRNKLWQALRWNRTLDDPPAPAVLHYTLNGKRADLYVYYAGDVTARIGNSNVDQTIGVRLVAYDPLWYSPTQKSAHLLYDDTLAVSYLVGRINGRWNAMGNVGTNTVKSIVAAPDGDTVYIAGIFVGWDGAGANSDYIAKYTISTDTWTNIGMPDDNVWKIILGPDGTLYVAGGFLNIGAMPANYIAAYDTNTNTWSTLGVGLDAYSNALAMDRNGLLYVGGNFLNAGGAAASHIATWDGANWAEPGGGVDDLPYDIIVMPDNSVVAGGAFLNAGGNPASYIAHYDPIADTWSAMGGGGANALVMALALAPNGTLYVAGNFTMIGGITVDYIAKWNGFAFLELMPVGSGPDNTIGSLAVSANGTLYLGGAFTQVGGNLLPDRVAAWNGTTYRHLDIDLPGATFVDAIATHGENVFLGFEDAGNATTSHATANLNTTGDFETFPIITIVGPGTLQSIFNETTGDQLLFDMWINAGETITIDLSPGVKAMTSDWPWRPGPMAGLLLPQSDLGKFSLKPDPVAANGDNLVTVYITDETVATDVVITYYDRHLSVDHAIQ